MARRDAPSSTAAQPQRTMSLLDVVAEGEMRARDAAKSPMPPPPSPLATHTPTGTSSAWPMPTPSTSSSTTRTTATTATATLAAHASSSSGSTQRLRLPPNAPPTMPCTLAPSLSAALPAAQQQPHLHNHHHHNHQPVASRQPEYSLLSLTIWEQQALITAFEKEDPGNHGLAPDQFRRAAGNFLASKTTSDPAAIFAIFDTNGTGRITKREFLCGYAILCKGSTDERIRYLFNMFDVSEDGALGRDQLIGALKLVSKCAKSAGVVVAPPPPPPPLAGANNNATQPCPIPMCSDGEVLPNDGASRTADEVGDLEITEIADSILDGADYVTYADFFDIVTSEPTVMTWLESLAAGAGEYINDMRAISENALREVAMLRAKVIGPESPFQAHLGQRTISPRLLQDGNEPDCTSPPSSWRSPGRLRRMAASMPITSSIGHVANAPQNRSWNHASRAGSRGDPASPNRPNLDLADLLIDYDSIRFKKEIGRGACATVYAAEWLHMPVAVKVFDRQSAVFGSTGSNDSSQDDRQRDIMSEINVLTKLRHPNVCLYMGMCKTQDKICIVSELYFGGSVHEFLHGLKPRRFSPLQALEMISNVARAMVYLHSKPHVLHRDLKASNILVNGPVTHCVVCDFGLSRIVKDNSGNVDSESAQKSGMIGTPYTMAPEVIRGCRYSPAADVYSFGIVAWEMWTGEMPFEGLKPMQIMYKVVEGVRPPVSVDKIRSQKFASLLEACWAQEPDDRPNFDSILYELDDASLAEDVGVLQREYELLMKRTSEVSSLSEKQKIEALSRGLMDVMQSGDVKEAGRLVAAGAQVHYADYDRRRPLHIAAAEGHKECVLFLLSHGARVLSQDRWGGTPIDDAKQGGHREIVSILLAARSNPEKEPPSNSLTTLPDVCVGDERQSQSFVDPLMAVTGPARSNGDIEWKGDVKSRRSRMRVAFEMMFGVHDHDIDLVRNLLAGSHDVNGIDYDSRTPLHIAAAVGDKEIAQLLIEHGADVFAVDKWGVDPFREAQLSDHLEVAHIIEKVQLERGESKGVHSN